MRTRITPPTETRAPALGARDQQWQRNTGENWRRARGRVLRYVRLTRLDRPIGILLLLWPALWALWIAVALIALIAVGSF